MRSSIFNLVLSGYEQNRINGREMFDLLGMKLNHISKLADELKIKLYDGCSVPYIFDTNCFIEGWHRTYTLKIMPDYWKLLAEDIVSGHIISPSQVKEEIYKKDDDLKTWMKKRQIVPKLLQEEKQQIENKVQEI